MWHLMHGARFTTADVARITGLSHNAAWYMLTKISRVVPLVQTVDAWHIDIQPD